MTEAAPRVGIVVQARASSARLPGKVLADLHGAPLIVREIERLRRVPGVDRIVVATSDAPADDGLAETIESHGGVGLFRGPEHDVLARYASAARAFGLDAIGRVTGDCPLIDPEVVGRVLTKFRATPGCDYASNCRPRSWPHGFDVEFVSRAALEAADAEARDGFDREHVLVHVFTRPERFVCVNVEADDRRQERLRLTVDYPADLEFVRAVYAALYDATPDFRLADIVELLARRPALLDINRGVPAHESIIDPSQRGHPRAVTGARG